jgi:uncharacterized protein (TIGR03086 family)
MTLTGGATTMTDLHQPVVDIDGAAEEVSALVRTVRDDQLTHPTPCAGSSVATLLDHLMGLSLAFTWAATKSAVPDSDPESGGPEGDGPREAGARPPASAEHLEPDWRTVLPQRLTDLAKAWRHPSAWVGRTQAGGIQMPAEVAAVVTLDELVLHGWDLARATGQSFSCSPANAAAILDFTEKMAQPGQLTARAGLFGPVVDVPDDAPTFDRALGFAGRDPGWSPPVG